MYEIDEKALIGWKLTSKGELQTVYHWIKNPNITVTFTDDGHGTSFIVMYQKAPLGFLAHSDDEMNVVIERLMPMINNELNWFISRFRNLLSELSDRISNNYALIDALVSNKSDFSEEER